MKCSALIASFLTIMFWWVFGVGMGMAKIAHDEAARERPYAMIMHEAVDGLRAAGYDISYPRELPKISSCETCLKKSRAFAAYQEHLNQVVVPDNFDLKTPEGHAMLIHEYGHYLLSRAGVPASQQEALCLQLGNNSYHQIFMAAFVQ